MKRSPSTGRWAVLAWLLAAVFFGVSYIYGLNGNALGWLIWLILSFFWCYVAVTTTIKQYKNWKNRSNP